MFLILFFFFLFQRNTAPKDYIIELQEIFMKLGMFFIITSTHYSSFWLRKVERHLHAILDNLGKEKAIPRVMP